MALIYKIPFFLSSFFRQKFQESVENSLDGKNIVKNIQKQGDIFGENTDHIIIDKIRTVWYCKDTKCKRIHFQSFPADFS